MTNLLWSTRPGDRTRLSFYLYDETQTPKIKLPSLYFIFSPQLQLLMALFILLKWSYCNKNSFVINSINQITRVRLHQRQARRSVRKSFWNIHIAKSHVLFGLPLPATHDDMKKVVFITFTKLCLSEKITLYRSWIFFSTSEWRSLVWSNKYFLTQIKLTGEMN